MDSKNGEIMLVEQRHVSVFLSVTINESRVSEFRRFKFVCDNLKLIERETKTMT